MQNKHSIRRIFTLPLQACLALSLSSSWLLAEDSPAPDGTYSVLVSLPVVPSVSEQFKERVEFASETIPNNIWSSLKQAGWRVELAPFVVDAVPGLKGVHPRGWPKSATWENAEAAHLPRQRLLVIAEWRRNRAGESVPSNRMEGVLRHEVGHAFDMASKKRGEFLSAGQAFLTAYQKDASAATGKQRQALAYYLQANDAGRQETFAEAFAIALGGGSDTSHREEFQEIFPNVLLFLEEAIEHYQPVRTNGIKNDHPVKSRIPL